MLVSIIFRIKYCLTKVLEQQGGGTPVLNVMVILEQHHANISKQRRIFADINIAPPHGMAK